MKHFFSLFALIVSIALSFNLCATPWHDGPPVFFKMLVEKPQTVDSVFYPLPFLHPVVDSMDLIFEIHDQPDVFQEFIMGHRHTLLLDF
jgi:hypothetical protein